MDQAIIPIALIILSCGGYLAWPSRWNVPAHLGLGFSTVAYIVPTLIGADAAFPPQLVHFDAQVLGFGAMAYALGIIAGSQARFPTAPWEARQASRVLPPPVFARFVTRRSNRFAIAGLASILTCFYLMGFVPAFSRYPIMAKFFRGSYAISYAHVAVPYRFSYLIIVAIVPTCLAAWLARRNRLSLLLALASIATIAATLNRGPIAAGALLFLGVIAARRKSTAAAFILFVLIAYPIGSAFYKLIGYQEIGLHANLWSVIAAGAPDIRDQLGFFFRFFAHPIYSHGRTFWGGLIPWHYKWNPAVFTLELGGQNASLNSIASGGLRLAAPQWGFVAFGWAGVPIVSFASGLVWGYATNLARRSIDKTDVLQAIVTLVVYTSFWGMITQFYLLSVYALPAAGVAAALGYPLLLSNQDILRRAQFIRRRQAAPTGVAST